MNKRELKKFKKLLLEERERVLHDIGFLSQNDKAQSRYYPSSYGIHMADVGNDEEEMEKQHLLLTEEGKSLALIDEALKKIENGKFGICERCGEPIIKSRLEARPYASFCYECKQAEERAG